MAFLDEEAKFMNANKRVRVSPKQPDESVKKEVVAVRLKTSDRSQFNQPYKTRNVRTSNMPGNPTNQAGSGRNTIDEDFTEDYAKQGLQPTGIGTNEPREKYQQPKQIDRSARVEHASTAKGLVRPGVKTFKKRKRLRKKLGKKAPHARARAFKITSDENAIELTKKNIEKFGLTNISVIHGNAKEKIHELEEADTIFIGGTGGDTKEIVELCENKLKSGGRIVVGIILIETLYSVLQVLEKLEFESVDITQVTISKSRKTSTGTMMLARNPVTIISATKI